MSSSFTDYETSPFFGFLGAAAALVFSCMGATYGMTKSGVGVASMGLMRPELMMKSIVPVVMARVLSIYEGKDLSRSYSNSESSFSEMESEDERRRKKMKRKERKKWRRDKEFISRDAGVESTLSLIPAYVKITKPTISQK